MERITRRDCEALLRRLTAQTNLEIATSYNAPIGGLSIQEESGVKRLVSVSNASGGMSDHSWPGFSTYRELWGFLRGMVALAELRA